MASSEADYFASESARAALWIDELCDRFEALWQIGRAPAILDFVAGEAGTRRLAILTELVRLDQVYRAMHGEPRAWSDYRAEFPELPPEGDHDGRRSEACQSPSATDEHQENWSELPGYQITDEIGRGNMGVVYRARHLSLGRVVALKMILAGPFADEEQRARFRREAEAVARLRHPNIVLIYEIGEHNGLPYLSLEYVDGGSLALRLAGVPQPPRPSAELVAKIAAAAHAAHQQGIVHRDLKPSNILLTSDGEPKIADFGLAKQLNSDLSYTQTGVAIGTPSYMAPEQADGRNREVGPAADVYSLGTILYEMLTGRPPFRGATSLQTLDLLRTQEPVAPCQLQPRLPRDLETICLTSLAKDPARRYPTALALADDLGRWLAGKPIQARPVGSLERGWRWVKRNPDVAALLTVLLAVLVAGAVGITWQWRRAENNFVRSLAAATREADERARVESLLYAADVRSAAESYQSGDVVEAAHRLDRQRPTAGKPDRREFTWHRLQALCQDRQTELQGHQGDVYVVRVTRSGKSLITAGRDGTLRRWGVDKADQGEVLFSGGGELNFVALAPDDVLLATGSDDGIVRLFDLAKNQQISQFAAHADWALCGAISPAGDRLATAGRDNLIRLWSLPAGTLVSTLSGHTSTIESVAFLPDGSTLASTGTDRTVRLWQLATGEGTVLGEHPYPAFCVAVSHDGTQLATACEDHRIYVWDLTARSLRGSMTGHGESVQAVEFSPNDAWLASAGKDRTVRVWNVASLQQTDAFAGHRDRVWSVAWFADGTRLASTSGDGTVRTWNVGSQPAEQILDADMPEASDVFFVPGSRKHQILMQGATRAELWGQKPDGQGTSHVADGVFAYAARANKFAAVTSDRAVTLCDEAFHPLGSVMQMPFGIASLAISSDADLLAIGGRIGEVLLYELPNRKLRWSRDLAQGDIALEFDPTTSMLIAKSYLPSSVAIISIADGRVRPVPKLDRIDQPKGAICCSPDQRWLAVGLPDRNLLILEFASGAEVARLEGPSSIASGLQFSPDGQTLAAGTIHGKVYLWHTASWQLLAQFNTSLAYIARLRFSPEGDTLAMAGRSADGHGPVVLWPTVAREP